VEKEAERVAEYTRFYFEGLSLGASLPSTELQPADDLALLAGNAFISLWSMTNDEKYLLNASYFLEFALTKSEQSFLTRLLLIRIYRLLGRAIHLFSNDFSSLNIILFILGAPALVVEHYRGMRIKQVQHDTLSYLLLSRASTFSLASTGDLTFPTECLESTQVYLSNSQEVLLFLRLNFCVRDLMTLTDWGFCRSRFYSRKVHPSMIYH
jgi:N-terminal acetyltransferase B complex non-catalytic subunit